MTSLLRYKQRCDTRHRIVINRAKFDACISSSFRGGKTDRQTELRFTYNIQFLPVYVPVFQTYKKSLVEFLFFKHTTYVEHFKLEMNVFGSLTWPSSEY